MIRRFVVNIINRFTKKGYTEEELEEFRKLVEIMIHNEAPIILRELGIHEDEWNYKHRIRLYWEGPRKNRTGFTGILDDGEFSFGTVNVHLYVRNILRTNKYNNFPKSFIHTLAHELKHVQQIKNGYDVTGYIRPEDDIEGYKTQDIEIEAEEFARNYVLKRFRKLAG